MVKKKISKKQKTSSLKTQKPKISKEKVKKEMKSKITLNKENNITEYDPVENLLDLNKVGAAVMECLLSNDTEGVMEIIEGYLYAVNKTQFLKEADIPKTTFYHFLKSRNPTLKTLAKIMHATVK